MLQSNDNSKIIFKNRISLKGATKRNKITIRNKTTSSIFVTNDSQPCLDITIPWAALKKQH